MLQEAVIDAQTQEVLTPEVAVNWGTTIQTVVDFLIVAFCIFCAIKALNNLKRKKEEAPAPEAPAAPTTEQLLTEIRDILNKQSK